MGGTWQYIEQAVADGQQDVLQLSELVLISSCKML
jgi:hypothetical protein